MKWIGYILFENVSVVVRSKSKWPRGMYDLYPGYGQKIEKIKTSGFYMRRADDVVLRNCRVKFEGEEKMISAMLCMRRNAGM